MGETRPEIPITSQLVLMPPPLRDEVTLRDLWLAIARHKTVLWGVFLASVVSGIAFALLFEKEHVFRASIEIGTLPSKEGPRKIEAPETVIGKITESFVPMVTTDFLSQQPEFKHRLNLAARIPNSSNLVVVEAEAPEGMKDIYLSLIGQVVTMLEADHTQLLKKTLNGIEVRLTEAKGQVQQLEEEKSLLEQRIGQLTSGEDSFPAQIQSMKARVEDSRARYTRAQATTIIETDAFALQVMGDELRGDQASLLRLQEEFRYERNRLLDQVMATNQQLREERMLAVDIKNEREAIQETRAILAPMQLPDPIGPDRKLIIALAGVLGLVLGIVAALFAEFLSNARTDAAETSAKGIV